MSLPAKVFAERKWILEHGPLVYYLPIKEQWTPVIEPQWSRKPLIKCAF
jgi:hypothetical protein